MSKENYLKDLFIDEAKPALKRHSGGGGSGSSDLIECESLPTAGVQEGKIYRARWSETVETDPEFVVYITEDGCEPFTMSVEEFAVADNVTIVDTIDEIPNDPDVALLHAYICKADGILYYSQTLRVTDTFDYPPEVNVGFISGPDELDIHSEFQCGLMKTYDGGPVTINHEYIGLPIMTDNTKILTCADSDWVDCNIWVVRKLLEMDSEIFRDNHVIKSFKNIIGFSDTRNVTDMGSMFRGCTELTEVPLFDTHNVTSMAYMFYNCYVNLTEVPLFDTRNVTNMREMFCKCARLIKAPSFDTRNVTDMGAMFYQCYDLTECWLRNIKTTLQVGSGTIFGHLLTVESLVHLIYELRDRGSMLTLTVGSANLEKLASVYIKTVEITDEMRAEDDLVDEKLPFVVCESTDEGAMLITSYVAFKNWSLA